ncbi:hypothetical protein DFH08DRAFT_824814 [Mycena albidolilacea]|uniref:Uncharacterized protein n=1 Tax=Mycena albidolilacea TaxID=1033008 RepID=A0AAD6Z3P5_9AGAR|nr:hypothetical protein DFH08DRAFT_824814 [Mycena albidolilacea]
MGTVRMFVIVRQPMIFKNHSAQLSSSHAVVYISSAPPPPFSCDFPGIFEGGTDELGRRGGSFDGIDGKCQKGAPSDGSDGGMMGRQGSIASPIVDGIKNGTRLPKKEMDAETTRSKRKKCTVKMPDWQLTGSLKEWTRSRMVTKLLHGDARPAKIEKERDKEPVGKTKQGKGAQDRARTTGHAR